MFNLVVIRAATPLNSKPQLDGIPFVLLVSYLSYLEV